METVHYLGGAAEPISSERRPDASSKTRDSANRLLNTRGDTARPSRPCCTIRRAPSGILDAGLATGHSERLRPALWRTSYRSQTSVRSRVLAEATMTKANPVRREGNVKCRFLPVAVMAPALFVSLLTNPSLAQTQVGNYASHAASGRSVVVKGASGESLRITPYGDYMVRVQAAKNGESFYADDRYEIVESHDWDGELAVVDGDASLGLSTAAADGVAISLAKQPMRLSFALKSQTTALLGEQGGVTWSGNTVTESFTAPATDEHFAGLGHEAYGRVRNLDRRGTSLTVKSGNEGACVVPFYLSSKGYGVLLNTTFTHTISLGQNNAYSLKIDGEGYGGQMDYFFIAGPAVTQVIDRYTQLTGRPRMPQRSLFGLLLSDKTDPNNNGEQWWKQTITDHRNAGFAFDHQVNDNAWRASNESVSGQQNSWFEFRKDRYPDPAEYKRWCDENGVTVTLDLNRPGIDLNPSWNTALSIQGTNDCPDFTNPAARQWIWDLFFTKALDPALKYPGDAIWLDEFDYPDHAHSTTLSSGKKWAEESINYHFDLLKACVQEGWDVDIGEAKRPYFWSRGITAGAQRFGSYWTGDIDGNWEDMAYQVKAMQSAGLSGFPYFNHDAGAHFTPTVNEDNLYRQWDMAFGSFTPIWKPHGPGHKRWPLQRNATCQGTAKTYITLRYEMMPYIYSYAHIAQATGMPMARPMFFEDQSNETAWQKDLQYLWGHEMLVAPNCSDGNNAVSVWLPKGNWYYYWDDKKYAGDTTESITAATGVMPVFVREGAIIPMAPFAKSTFFIPKDQLVLHAYTGADGSFQLYEDDGVTEKFRTKNELRMTDLRYSEQDLGVQIAPAQGTYAEAPSSRSYQVVYHGLSATTPLYVNGTAIPAVSSQAEIAAGQDGAVWDADGKLLNVYVASRPVDTRVKISNSATDTPTPIDGTGGTAGTGGGSSGGRGGTTAVGGAPGTGGAGGNVTGSGGRGPGGGAGGSTVSGGAPGTGGAGGSATGTGGVGGPAASTGGAGGTAPAAGGTGPSSGVGGSTTAGGNSTPGSGGSSGTTGGQNGTGASPEAGGAPGSNAAGDDDGSGCGCRTTGAGGSGRMLPIVALLAGLGLRRRRSQRRA
jgi:MYXO-CTERM domain-containing protein